MAHRNTRFILVGGCLVAQLLTPAIAHAHGGLAEALLLAGFVIHLVTTLVLTLIGALIFGKKRKLRVFLLSALSVFFAEFSAMIVPVVMPGIGDSGIIVSYIVTIVAISLFFTALYGGAIKKRINAGRPPADR